MLRAAVALIIAAIAACALLSSYQHRPFDLEIDANPGAWPENARAGEGEFVAEQICMIVMRPVEKAKRISRT